jgi:hypothetical protein
MFPPTASPFGFAEVEKLTAHPLLLLTGIGIPSSVIPYIAINWRWRACRARASL